MKMMIVLLFVNVYSHAVTVLVQSVYNGISRQWLSAVFFAGNSPAGGGGARGVTFRDSFGTANQQNQSPYRWNASSSTGQPQQAPPQQGGGLSVHDIV